MQVALPAAGGIRSFSNRFPIFDRFSSRNGIPNGIYDPSFFTTQL